MALKVMINRLREFDKKVGRLDGIDLLHLNKILDQPFEPTFGVDGGFREKDIARLLDVVREYQDLHIVSLLGDGRVVVNRYIPEAGVWMLADGDSDPDLVSLTTTEYSEKIWDAFLDAFPKFGKCKLAP